LPPAQYAANGACRNGPRRSLTRSIVSTIAGRVFGSESDGYDLPREGRQGERQADSSGPRPELHARRDPEGQAAAGSEAEAGEARRALRHEPYPGPRRAARARVRG